LPLAAPGARGIAPAPERFRLSPSEPAFAAVSASGLNRWCAWPCSGPPGPGPGPRDRPPAARAASIQWRGQDVGPGASNTGVGEFGARCVPRAALVICEHQAKRLTPSASSLRRLARSGFAAGDRGAGYLTAMMITTRSRRSSLHGQRLQAWSSITPLPTPRSQIRTQSAAGRNRR